MFSAVTTGLALTLKNKALALAFALHVRVLVNNTTFFAKSKSACFFLTSFTCNSWTCATGTGYGWYFWIKCDTCILKSAFDFHQILQYHTALDWAWMLKVRGPDGLPLVLICIVLVLSLVNLVTVSTTRHWKFHWSLVNNVSLFRV